MSQSVIEAGIVATIKLHADFDDTNCYIYDRRALGKGLARLVIITYNQMVRTPLSLQVERRTWQYNVDIMVPWRGELYELDQRVGTEAQKLIDTLAEYPRLNGTAGVTRTDMPLASTPDVITQRKGRYSGRRHSLVVQETYTPARAE